LNQPIPRKIWHPTSPDGGEYQAIPSKIPLKLTEDKFNNLLADGTYVEFRLPDGPSYAGLSLFEAPGAVFYVDNQSVSAETSGA
jgi:hypothetical protein